MSMQTTDPIADLLTRIRNAKMVGKTEIRVPSSKLKKVVAEQLQKNGYFFGSYIYIDKFGSEWIKDRMNIPF